MNQMKDPRNLGDDFSGRIRGNPFTKKLVSNSDVAKVEHFEIGPFQEGPSDAEFQLDLKVVAADII